MVTVSLTSGRRRRAGVSGVVPAVVLGSIGVIVAAAIVAGIVSGFVGDAGSGGAAPDAPALTAGALHAYEAELVPVLQEGGTLVELGLKVGIGDLGGEPRTAPGVVAEQARAWQRDLERLSVELAAMTPPPALADAHRRMAEAIAGYARSARLIERAALADVQDRDALLDEAVRMGRAADERFDAGARGFQAARRGLGLDPHPDIADP